MDLPYEKRFHFRDGSSAGTLEELRRKIEGVSYQEFYHHVNAEKNDFANWIQHVLRDEDLAQSLRRISSIVETVEVLNDAIHPLPITSREEDFQRRIEEDLEIHLPMAQEKERTTETAPMAPQRPAVSATQPERTLSEHDYTRLIVKDFVYGIFFGLIIGIVLGRILTF